tara:strand:+ start:47736 stop:48806 length:1071 start_codon:yes stop_codon:yes gene_type:complete
MKLEDLYGKRSYRGVLKESSDLPLDPIRYPPVSGHRPVENSLAINMCEELERLDDLSKSNPGSAYKELRDLVEKDVVTGLKGGHVFKALHAEASDDVNENGLKNFIYVVGDVDDARHLNEKSGLGTIGVNSVIGYIGNLITSQFGGSSRAECYRLGGDTFAVSVYVGDTDKDRAQRIFADVIKRCILMSNTLAGQGFHHEGWSPERRVQPTISFGISDSVNGALGLMSHIKAGDSGRKPLKYMIVTDRDLRHKLEISVDDINRLKTQGSGGLGLDMMSVDSNEGLIEADMKDAGNKPGVTMVECGWTDVPSGRKKNLGAFNESKNRYNSKEPAGAAIVDERRGTCVPLKEQFKYPG